MKHLFIIIGLAAICARTQAQTWNEWFRQKRTQIRYYVEQITALQVYIELGQKGYGIYQDGLNAINDIKQGDFDLHNNYFNSLSAVKPSLRNSSTVQRIPLLRQMIITMCTGVPENDYARSVRNALLFNNNQQYEEYILLTTNNHYALHDAERIKRLKLISQEMTDQYLFIKGFVYENRVLDHQRESERNDVRFLRRAVARDAATHP